MDRDFGDLWELHGTLLTTPCCLSSRLNSSQVLRAPFVLASAPVRIKSELPTGLRSWGNQSNSENMLEIIEPALDKVMIDFALEKTGGKKQEAAKVLGLGRNTLSKKIKAQQT